MKKNIKLSITGIISMMIITTISTGCNKSTSVEKETTVNPDNTVSQTTTVDKEVSTGIKTKDVVIDTEVKH